MRNQSEVVFWAYLAPAVADTGNGSNHGGVRQVDDDAGDAHGGTPPPSGSRDAERTRDPDEPPARSIEGVKAALAALPIDLERLINGKPVDLLSQPAQDGGWGMVEILPHMRDWEEVTHERVWRMLEQDRPEFADYDDSLWAIEHDYRSQDPHKVFDHFRRLRDTLTSKLDELDETDWQRTGVHPAFGEVSLHWLLDDVCDHDARHLDQARDALG